MDRTSCIWKFPISTALVVACFSGQLMAGWYLVRPGDTLWSISRRTGVSLAELERNNSIVNSRIRAGQRLWLAKAAQPKEVTSSASRHVVRAGETLWSIARRYGLGLERLRSMNGLTTDSLRVGQTLVLPETGRAKDTQERRTRPVLEPPLAARTSQSKSSFHWPLRGRIVEKFGIKDKGIVNGITIAAGGSSEVRCVATGEVAYADSLRGYGKMVVVRHEGGYHSIYAHLEKITVHKGQRVTPQTIVGQAGRIPGSSQLGVHFQLYSKGRAVDPLMHLRS